MTQFEQAKAMRAAIEAQVAEKCAKLDAYPRLPSGLTPDEVKTSPAFRKDKYAFDCAFQALRRFNAKFVKQFKAELRAERR